jgi:hypothetical protein
MMTQNSLVCGSSKDEAVRHGICEAVMLAPGSAAKISMDYLLSQMGRSRKSFIGTSIFVIMGSVRLYAVSALQCR